MTSPLKRVTDPIGWLVYMVRRFGFEFVFKRYYGIYRAIVIDNRDPEQRFRVRLQIPSIGHTTIDKVPEDIWALPADGPKGVGEGGGQASGMFFPPDVDDRVWCMFENGRPDEPVYIGGWMPQTAFEAPEFIEEDDKYKGFRTKTGHFLRFNDKDGELGILIARGDGDGSQNGTLLSLSKSADGDFDDVVLANDSGAIVSMNDTAATMFAPDGSNISVGDDKVVMMNKSGSSYSMDGGNIEVSGSGNFTVAMGGKITLKAPCDIGPGPVYQPAVMGQSFTILYSTHIHTSGPPGAPTSPQVLSPPVPNNGLTINVKLS